MRKHLSIRYTIVTDNVFLSPIDLNKKTCREELYQRGFKPISDAYSMKILYIVDLPNMVYWF